MSQEGNNKPEKKESSKRATIKDIIEIVIFLGIAILLVFSMNWILQAALHTDSPLVVVTSESMEPTYWGSRRENFGGQNDIRKDMLVVRGVDPSEIKVGDVIVFYRILRTNSSAIDYVNEPIVHRVNRIYFNSTSGEYWFTTKGDNPQTNDRYVDYDIAPDVDELRINEFRLIGKIVGRVPYLGGIISYFKTKTGRYVLIAIVAVILIATFFFGSSDDKDEDVFNEEKKDTKEIEEKKKSGFFENLKIFYRRTMKYKHIVFPSVILVIIVFIPIIDTFAANWGSPYGVTDASFDGAETKTLRDGSFIFAYADVTISCPGHWHQQFRSFTLQIINQTTGEVLGESNWTIVYNFEGEKSFSNGAWLDPAEVTLGMSYNLIITAHLRSKFGRESTNVFTTNFVLELR
ncbi:MAG: signal peptidase I [Candidatus Heimdallarchaeota archaeon]